jgi:adenosylcobalamin-dependent ribonucleoside-triphosphate reductase
MPLALSGFPMWFGNMISTRYQDKEYHMEFTVRPIHKGMGEAVAKRTVYRPGEDWLQVADRVSLGNSLLHPTGERDREGLKRFIAKGAALMSGRHLQHGDANQHKRNIEVFTNCATAALASIKFYLMMNGSGVGRCYDDRLTEIMNWNNAPNLQIVLSKQHKDYTTAWIDADMYPAKASTLTMSYHVVEDSREGWAKAFEMYENITYGKEFKDHTLILDFSHVRPKDSPIAGMQNRPSAGPVPLMEALMKVATVKGRDWKPWKQQMFIDHYMAECVVVGGARRASRISVKHWKEVDIVEYIKLKVEHDLWTSNNSVAVDEEFWSALDAGDEWATMVFNAMTSTAYDNKAGEPGYVQVDKLVSNNSGMEAYREKVAAGQPIFGSDFYKVSFPTQLALEQLLELVLSHSYRYIVNPCGEIVLFILGGYCVIADGVLYHCDSLEEGEELVRHLVRALIRTNLMPSLYQTEVDRTNRIGVSLTGIHEFAWKFFGFTFRDLLDWGKSKAFWLYLSHLKDCINDECTKYSNELGVVNPHTNTTIKPAGTTSKLFGLTEGAHLPAMLEFLRWVQFQNDNPLVAEYAAKGYPTKELKTYAGVTIVGFPTQPEIARLGMSEIVTASQASMNEQYMWVQLLELYWLKGLNPSHLPFCPDTGNQVSYTCKYDHSKTSYEDFQRIIRENQRQVKCFTVMPEDDHGAYEYLPETVVTAAEFTLLLQGINDPEMIQEIDMEHLRCSSGACPI